MICGSAVGSAKPEWSQSARRAREDSNLQCSETSTTWSRAGRRRALPEAVCHDFL